ncbi:MAG: sugar phosphate isomerase/epimerase [Lentisphaeria bacterium]|nr:sugar phosphate isomerase/epimerase [Lentisphaeria bacterium]
MFNYGLGTSLSSLCNTLLERDLLKALRNSKVQTFELNAHMFDYDYDGAIRKEFKAMLAETGKKVISFHVPFSGIDDLSNPDETTRTWAVSRFRAHGPVIREFGCKFIVLHPSPEIRTNVKAERDERIDCLKKSLREVEGELRELNVQLALEFLPRLCIGNKLADMDQILEGMNPEIFGVCFDVNHIMNQYPLIPEITRKLGKRLFTTHISDYNGIDECHWLPGMGVIDWQRFVEALRDIDYRGPFNYEIKIQEGNCERRVRTLEENFARIRGLLK